MVSIPEEVKAAIDKTSPVCIATADNEGNPNIVYVKFLKYINDTTVVIADNKFVKTKKNIDANGNLAFVVLDNDTRKAYQLKGKVDYVTEGERYQDVVNWVKSVKPDMQPNAGVYLNITEIFCGAEKIA